MKRAWLVGWAAIWVACGGTVSGVSPDCPKTIARGDSCTKSGLECPFTLVEADCFGGKKETPSSCTCSANVWNCPEIRPQPCPPMIDASPPIDAGMTDGGPSDPKSITCDGKPCAVPANYCCDVGTLPNPGMMTCVPSTTSSCGGLRRTCDETADCDPGNVCCIPPNQAIPVAYNSQCVPAAQCSGMDPYAYRMCKSSSECPANVACVTQPCHGYVISTCGGIPSQRCQ